jgi:serine/threonine protein kinase
MADSSSLIGQTISHYRILEKVGEGGMGVVYKAHDLHLDRFVALKLLPSEKLADETRRQRFVQEAKAASALNHPNIIHIYDVTEANGKPFLAMEYVAGRTLSQVIARKGIGLHEALKIATQIADAFAKAHAAGIVHRDLKPSNIMVTQDGLVKVLDFGLAKLTETNSEDSIETRSTKHYSPPRTEEGVILGTAGYMSPEQAEGKSTDARSDIFSFGVVLYEMLSGRRAFQGENQMRTVAKVLREEPPPLHESVESIPPELERLVARCLRRWFAKQLRSSVVASPATDAPRFGDRGRSIDPKLFHPVDQRCSLHSQARGSATPSPDDPVAGLQRSKDMISFYLCETVDRSNWFSVRLERLQFGNWSAQYRLRRENYCAFNKVLQFANVPGPFVSNQRLHRLQRDDVYSLIHALGVECREMPHQPRNIFGALSERRNLDRKYLQTVV